MPRSRFRLAAVEACAAVLAIGWQRSACARSLSAEASSLRSFCLANAAALTSARVESRVSQQRLDARGTAAGDIQERTERVTWDKPGRRMKWASPQADPAAYAADAKAGTLRMVSRALSATLTDLPADRAEEYTTPFPGWFWRPEWIVPASPANVREDGAALVLISATGDPHREVWLDRTRGFVVRFTETDATGATIRDVVLSGWAKASGVWLPDEIVETIRGARAGLRRTIRFAGVTVNAPVAAADLTLP